AGLVKTHEVVCGVTNNPQVPHHAMAVKEDVIDPGVGDVPYAEHLVGVVDSRCVTVGSFGQQGTEVGHRPPVIEESMPVLLARRGRIPNNLVEIVDIGSRTVQAATGA